jgi:hypothetical protein
VSELVPVRLTSEFRGHPAGAVIQATPGLAGFLTSTGRATPAPEAAAASRADRVIEQAVARGAGS